MKPDNHFSITEAKLIYYSLPDDLSPAETEDFTFDIKPFKLEMEAKQLRFHSVISISTSGPSGNTAHDPVLKAESEVIFAFDKLPSDQDKPDAATQQNLESVAYSTIRGLIAGVTKGTAFHKAYLPLQHFSTPFNTEEDIEEHEIETPVPPM